MMKNALHAMRVSERIHQALHGDKVTRETCEFKRNVARLCELAGDQASALRNLQRLLHLEGQCYGEGSAEVAVTNINIACLLVQQKDETSRAQAMMHHDYAIAIINRSSDVRISAEVTRRLKGLQEKLYHRADASDCE